LSGWYAAQFGKLAIRKIRPIGKSFGAIPKADADKIYFTILMLIAQKFPSQVEQQLKNLQKMEKATGIQ
jgi:hypothetical protein